jgi:hypothetical protein
MGGSDAESDVEVPDGRDLKGAVMAAIREHDKFFFGMVAQQAQRVEVEGDALVFTFSPVHRSLRARLDEKRGTIEGWATAAAGRRVKILSREGQPVPVAAREADPASAAKKADLTARAKAEPSVQAVLDVFGGEIEDVEEIK